MKTLNILTLALCLFSVKAIAQEAPQVEANDTTEKNDFSFDIKDCENDGLKDNKNIAHWAGFEMGVNGYTNANGGFDMENNLYDLDYSRSLFVNLNLMEHKIPFFKGHGGLVTGMGFTFNSYQFKGNTVLVAENGTTTAVNNEGVDYNMNRLNASYVKVPLILEFNSSLKSKKSFHLGAGVEGGFKLGARMKEKFKEDGDRFKTVSKGHYNLNPVRLNATARVGYGSLTLFANYGLTPLFEKGAGPELYPFEVGITIAGF